MSPREQADFEQRMTTLRESLPSIWWALYAGCIDKGFREDQAMALVCAFIRTPPNTSSD